MIMMMITLCPTSLEGIVNHLGHHEIVQRDLGFKIHSWVRAFQQRTTVA